MCCKLHLHVLKISAICLVICQTTCWCRNGSAQVIKSRNYQWFLAVLLPSQQLLHIYQASARRSICILCSTSYIPIFLFLDLNFMCIRNTLVHFCPKGIGSCQDFLGVCLQFNLGANCFCPCYTVWFPLKHFRFHTC